MNERTKKIMLIILFAAGSAYFLYNGFATLFSERNGTVLQQSNSGGN